MSTSVLGEERGGVVRLTLNRPEKRNALSHEMLGRLDHALDGVANDPDARVVILAASGPVFSAGHDLGEMVGRTETRFLIITHHAVTMARMDRLFGVTMAEPGVSQLVSVDLAAAERITETAG